MAVNDNGRLYNAFVTEMNISADDNATRVVDAIEKKLDELAKKAEQAGKAVDSALSDNVKSLKEVADAYDAQRQYVESTAERIKKLRAEQEKYRQLANQHQGDELGAQYGKRLRSIDKELKEIQSSFDSEKEILAQRERAYKTNADSILRTISDLGKEIDNALKKQEEDEGKGKSGRGDRFLRRLGFDKEAIKNFKANWTSAISSIKGVLSGGGGLAKAAGTAAGAMGGLVGAIASTALSFAINKLNQLVRKGIQAIKSWGELKRAIRDGMGAAAADSAAELRRLDDLNNKLKTAEKGTAAYADARKQVISQYGQYNRYLQQEIDKVGDLSTTYDQLRTSIIAANVEKQRQKALEANDERTGEKLSESTGRLYQQVVKLAGKEDASRVFGDLMDSLYSGTEPEYDLARVLTRSGAYRQSARILRRGTRRGERINGAMRNESGDLSADFSIEQERASVIQSRNDAYRRQKQAEIDIENEYNQRLVSAMRDGAAKQMAQAKLDFERRKQQNKAFIEEYVRQREEERRIIYEADHGPNSYNPNSKRNILLKNADRYRAQKEQERLDALDEQAYKQQLSDIAFQQRQQLASSYGTLAQQKAAAEARWGREGITSEYRDRADAIHAYEFSKMDYEAIQKYGTQSQIRAALENMLDAEIKTLEDAEKPAAEARKKVTLAEFDSKLAEEYGGRMAGRDALEASLNAELETIDEKYREIKEVMNLVRLAEYDVETANQYGNRSERRTALESLLNARKNEYLKRNPGADASRIDARNASELAKFDWDEIADYGSYEVMLETLRAKWIATINELPDDLKEGATRKMRKEILDLEMANSAEYKKIFSDADSMTKASLEDTIKYAEAFLQAKVNAGASLEEIKALRDQIDKLRQAGDNIDFGGWGGTLQGFVQARNRRNNAVGSMSSLFFRERELKIAGADKENTQEWQDLQLEIGKTTEAIVKWGAEMAKQAAVIAASGLGNILTQIGSAMAEIASISGDDKLAVVAEGFSEIGGAISNIAQGFASGGLWGGIATAVTTVASKIVEAFTSVAIANAKYEKFLDDFKHNLDMLQLEVKDADFSNAFGVDDYGKFVSAYDKMTEAVERFTAASGDLNAMSVKTKDYSWWANLFGKGDEFEGLKGFDVWGEDGLLDVSKARAFLDASVQLTDAQRQEIENAIELKEAYDSLHDAASDFVSSLTGSIVDSLAGEMVQNFLDTGRAIVDADKYLQDFNKNLATSIVKSMLMKQIFTEEAQDNIADLIANGDTRGAVSAYNDLLQQANELAPEIENFLRGAGVTADAYNQAATAGGFQTMSQDVASELNGRFTALQIAGENILVEARGIHADTTSVADGVAAIQGLALLSMGHLEDIAKYTSVLPSMSDRMERIERYTKQMVS